MKPNSRILEGRHYFNKIIIFMLTNNKEKKYYKSFFWFIIEVKYKIKYISLLKHNKLLWFFDCVKGVNKLKQIESSVHCGTLRKYLDFQCGTLNSLLINISHLMRL